MPAHLFACLPAPPSPPLMSLSIPPIHQPCCSMPVNAKQKYKGLLPSYLLRKCKKQQQLALQSKTRQQLQHPQGSRSNGSDTGVSGGDPDTCAPANTGGQASASASASAMKRVVPIHTFGFGSDHDSGALHAIAHDAGGVFSFIEEEQGVQVSNSRTPVWMHVGGQHVFMRACVRVCVHARHHCLAMSPDVCLTPPLNLHCMSSSISMYLLLSAASVASLVWWFIRYLPKASTLGDR